MKKNILILAAFLFVVAGTIRAQDKKFGIYGLAFYNLENLFDTIDDEGVNDEEFTPTGGNAWTMGKYKQKQANMAFAISKLGLEYCPDGPAVIGVAEIENRGVLEDLVNTEPIKNRKYGIVHYDSPDRRGIDVALLYNPKLFKVISSKIYPYNMPEKPDFKTRDQLLVTGELVGEKIHIIVGHWPSRWGGARSVPMRNFAAGISKHIADSLHNADPSAKVVIMGDLNDNPDDESVVKVLGAKQTQGEVKEGGFFNTMWGFYARGIGTLGYQDRWSLFDQIIISETLLGRDSAQLKFWKGEIFNKDFLIQKTGKNKGYPHRTFSRGVFINGYSDHFPTLIYLVKSIE